MPLNDKIQQPTPGAVPPEQEGTRGMTAGERALAETAFAGKDMGYESVRLCNGHGGNPAAMMAFANGNPAITLSKTIYFKGRFSDDFSTAPDRDRVLLMHEMTHIWQYRSLGFVRFMLRYAAELVRCKLNPKALYDYHRGVTRFDEATLESQAEMVGDYKRATLSGDTGLRDKVAKNLAGTGFYGL